MIFNNDEVGKMVSEIKSLATPLQDLILREAMTDRDYANKAAAELLALRERVAKLEKVEECAKKLVALRGVAHGAWVIEELDAALKSQ